MNYQELDLLILKSLVTNKKNALEFVSECDAKIFSPEIWNAANIITGYIKTYKEVPTLRVLSEKLSKGSNTKLLDHVKDVWQQLDSIQYNNAEYKHDLEKIKTRFAEKLIFSIKDSLSKAEPGSVDINKTVADIQKSLQAVKGLDGSKTFESKNVKDYLSQFTEKFNAKKNNPDFEVGLKTKYSFIDFATNGLKPADFLLISGESGFGKSLFLQNIAVQVWMQDNTIDNTLDNFTGGKNIIYFSLEMPYEDCFNRFISRLSGVSSRRIENATLDKEEFAKVRKCLEFIKNYPFSFKIVDIADASANDIEAILNDCEEQFDCIFIDYLGIMKTNEKSEEADWLKQGVISYETRRIARRHRLPIFSAVQLNRKSSGKGSKDSSENIGLSRLARSGTIATHATHVIQIENRVNEEMYNDFLYHIIKNRKGPKGKGTLYKNLACASLIDKEIKNKDEKVSDQDDISEEIRKIEL